MSPASDNRDELQDEVDNREEKYCEELEEEPQGNDSSQVLII